MKVWGWILGGLVLVAGGLGAAWWQNPAAVKGALETVQAAWIDWLDPLPEVEAWSPQALERGYLAARRDFKTLKEEGSASGVSFAGSIVSIEEALDKGEGDLKRERWQTATALLMQATNMMGRVARLQRDSERVGRTRLAAMEMRRLAAQAGAADKLPDLWAKAGMELDAAQNSMQGLDFSTAIDKYRGAAILFTQAEERALLVDRFEALAAEAEALMDEGELELVRTYGGPVGERLVYELERASPTGGLQRGITAYETVVQTWSDRVAAAREQKTRIQFDEHLAGAAEARAQGDSSRAAALYREALATGHDAIGPVLRQMAELCEAAGWDPGVSVSIPLAEGVALDLLYLPVSVLESTPRPLGIWLGQSELRQDQYAVFTYYNPSEFKGETLPIESVDWSEAMAWADALSDARDVNARLPTSAEWEAACRAGTTTAWWFGDSAEEAGAFANFCDAACRFPWRAEGIEDGFEAVAPVGSFAPNAWGFHDMHGNVLEWCLDGPAAPEAAPPGLPVDTTVRYVRGGAWLFPAARGRADIEGAYPASLGNEYTGFRIVIDPGGTPAEDPAG